MAIEKLKVKAAWQLYAGANDVEPSVANQISKFIDQYELDLKHADDENKDSIIIDDYIPAEYVNIFKESNEYQQLVINLKVHACGCLILDGDIRREIGLISAVSETTEKRTLCACVEGGVLDEFGFVKEDFLIVDSVSLTHKCFQEIGKEVPEFEELRDMIENDEPTWQIYEKGITCCINQCEKESTTAKVKKYKPKNLGELSAFIAGIRPGFASLISTFINREQYTTGEANIDNLLEDTSHFMIFQESIMKVLSFLGLEMGETYSVIKSISKKKLKGEKKEKLLKQLKQSWLEKFGNLDNFNNVWKVIEDSASYAFNSPHALAMGGDSAYLAWFKAHHTREFYQVAIRHYQVKNNKDKINALIQEAIKFYNYELGSYEFGKDNRQCTVEDKIIYPNLSSIKGMGEKVANTLYTLGQQEYDKFSDVVTTLLTNGINKTIFEKLIRINYFKNFGNIEDLLKEFQIYQLAWGISQINKEKALEENIPFELLSKHGNETKCLFNKIDSVSLYEDLVNTMPSKPLTLREKLIDQNEILNVVSLINENVGNRLFFILDLEVKKSIVNASIYQVKTGKTIDVKMWTNSFNKMPFEKNDLIYAITIDKKNKKEPTGEINPITGKKIYADVPDKFENWLTRYTITTGDDEYDNPI